MQLATNTGVQISPLHTWRNVYVIEDTSERPLAGFWQYGEVTHKTLYLWLSKVFCVWRNGENIKDWRLHAYSRSEPKGIVYSPDSNDAVEPGIYIMLSRDTSYVVTSRKQFFPHPFNPLSNAPPRDSIYVRRARERDRTCRISGTASFNSASLRATHIFPRSQDLLWERKHLGQHITDRYPGVEQFKPDSVQNVILLRTDIHQEFKSHHFGIDVDNNYKVVAFIRGLERIAQKRLDLDHVDDVTIRPQDDILKDHFDHCLFTCFAGSY